METKPVYEKDAFLSRMARHLMINASFMGDSGLYYGKMGVLLFFAHFSVNLFAQSGDNTLFHSVAERFQEYTRATPQEKIYLHQDRTVYSAGETLWFKAYQSIDLDNPVESGVLYVDIVDGLNNRIVDTQWKLEDGASHGSITLSDTLSSGKYQLRAYTQWMQNYGPDAFFTREISVVSKNPELFRVDTDISLSGNTITAILQFEEVPQSDLGYRLRINGEDSERYPLLLDEKGEVLLEIELPAELVLAGVPFFILETPEGVREYPISLSPAIGFSLFPEGGNLVCGIPSKVAFKVNDRQGRGLSAGGVVVDEAGNEVRRFQTQHLGHGSFLFVPEAGKRYKAVLDEIQIETDLPEALPSGLVMGVTHRDDRLRITLRHNLQSSVPLYLTVHRNGSAWFNARVDITSPVSVVDIPHDKLPEGIFIITLYNEHYHAFAERLCLVSFPEQLPLQIKTERTEYGRREKVTVELEAANGSSLTAGDFSVAVVKSRLDDIRRRDNHYSYFHLSHELKGKVEDPYSYFTAPDSVAIPNMDLLLLTQGWRRYSWDKVMEKEYPELTYYAEPGLTFSGKVHPENEKQKIEDIEVTAVFRHDDLNDIQSFQPAEGGEFTFTNYDFRDTAEVIISALYKRRALDVSAKELSRAKPDYYYYGGLPEKEKEEGRQQDTMVVVSYDEKKGIDERVHELAEVSVTARAKRMKTYNRYHVVLHEEAFVARSYKTKKELSYTVNGGSLGAIGILYHVPGVIVGANGSSIRVAGSGGLSSNFKTSIARKVDPVYILDGIETTLANLAMIPPSVIERVEVLNPASAMMYKSGAWGGAIVFYTRSWEGMIYSIPTKTLSYRFVGYNQEKEFYSPDYTPGIREYIDPDHRNTLYWQPEVKVNEEGKAEVSFFTSDDKGEYVIHCEGRSDEGVIGVEYVKIEID